MSKILSAFNKNKVWEFSGGVHPAENKTQSNQTPIITLSLGMDFFVPIIQHAGNSGDLIVKVGDPVKKGQALTHSESWRDVPVHAPTSGVVVNILDYSVPHPSGLKAKCVHIQADGKDQWREQEPYTNYQAYSVEQLQERIFTAGITGLGGAVFPSAVKIQSGIEKTELLIINAMECEPYITCDDRLMQDHAKEIVQGMEILTYILKAQKCVIALEDNKPEAYTAIQKALKQQANPKLELRCLPTKYPSGNAKHLIYLLTGIELASKQRTSSIGALVLNVGTVFAIQQAIIEDKPLVERVVTLTGNHNSYKGNVWARIGTPIKDILHQANQEKQFSTQPKIIIGGSMMGFELPNWEAPISKGVNCLIVPEISEEGFGDMHEQPCIRCSACVTACPVGLAPQTLYQFGKSGEHGKAKENYLFDCIECGACSYVCPSAIPLVQYFRESKAFLKQEEQKNLLAQQAKERFEARKLRLEKEVESRKARIDKVAENRRSEIKANSGVDPVMSAIARLKAKQAGSNTTERNASEDNLDIRALRKARREQSLKPNVVPNNMVLTISEPIPRLKITNLKTDGKPISFQLLSYSNYQSALNLKPQASVVNLANQPSTELKDPPKQDPKKLAVAQAIARAKAKQAEKNGKLSTNSEGKDSSTEEKQTQTEAPQDPQKQDPKKLAVAQAIARAKIKQAERKAQLQANLEISQEASPLSSQKTFPNSKP